MTWFAAAMPFITGASTVISTASTIQQGRAAQAAGEFNARVSEAEAKVAREQAARDEEALRRESTSLLGKQRAAIAEAGLSSGGTTGLLADQSAVLAELDALNIRYQGATRGTGLLSQAAASRFGGAQSRKAAGLLAGAQLVSGVGDTYRMSRTVRT